LKPARKVPVSAFSRLMVVKATRFVVFLKVDLGEEFRIGGKGGCSSTSKAIGLKNPIAGKGRFAGK
jgi:hypothetical protein